MLPGTTYAAEVSQWLEDLEKLQLENVQLKLQVARILKNEVTGVALDHLEYFLNRFINKDAVLALLRRDVFDHLKAIGEGAGGEMLYALSRRQLKLRMDVSLMIQEFGKLKLDFSNYTEMASF